MRITLANLEQATAQQVFDQVANHLLTQKKVCKTIEDGMDLGCAYRSTDGTLACAAGCLISDEEFKTRGIDEINTGVGWLGVIDELSITNKHSDLIGNLQDVHDSGATERWLEMLYVVANKFDLNSEGLNAYSS